MRWLVPSAVKDVVNELFVLYFDRDRLLLYLHGSENSGTYTELAEAVLGTQCELINGSRPYHVLAHLDRLIPTNVGLKDARGHITRFSMHAGSDVSQGLGSTQEHKTKTHITASGLDNGDRVSISAASLGRFWSPSTAPSLKAWTDWCDKQGSKLLDDSIDLQKVFKGFITPPVPRHQLQHIKRRAHLPRPRHTAPHLDRRRPAHLRIRTQPALQPAQLPHSRLDPHL